MWTGIWTGLSAPLISVEDRWAPMHPASTIHIRMTSRDLPELAECRRRDSNPRHADYDSACQHLRSGLNAGDSSVRGQHMDMNVDRRVIRNARRAPLDNQVRIPVAVSTERQ